MFLKKLKLRKQISRIFLNFALENNFLIFFLWWGEFCHWAYLHFLNQHKILYFLGNMTNKKKVSALRRAVIFFTQQAISQKWLKIKEIASIFH
jgi:hypothetical protein